MAAPATPAACGGGADGADCSTGGAQSLREVLGTTSADGALGCASCGFELPAASFSGTQRRKPPATRRCKVCTGAEVSPGVQTGAVEGVAEKEEAAAPDEYTTANGIVRASNEHFFSADEQGLVHALPSVGDVGELE
jgi:hypothetical protein